MSDQTKPASPGMLKALAAYPSSPTDEREFVRLVARLDHSGDDGYTYPDDLDDAHHALDRLIAQARDIMATPLSSAKRADHDGERSDGWRPEVRAFADLMEAQLRANDHKPGWKGEEWWPLLCRLREETLELQDALGPGSRTDLPAWSARVGSEAADVANFAMMIADVCGALPAPAGEKAINWEEVAEACAEHLREIATRYTLAKLAISNAIDILANRGRFGTPDHALENLRAALQALRSDEAPGAPTTLSGPQCEEGEG